MTDPIVSRLREQIKDADRSLVETINKRLELVQELWRYKQSSGMPFIDPNREEWMLRYLTRTNLGPLSAAGLAEIYAQVLELTKRETTREA